MSSSDSRYPAGVDPQRNPPISTALLDRSAWNVAKVWDNPHQQLMIHSLYTDWWNRSNRNRTTLKGIYKNDYIMNPSDC